MGDIIFFTLWVLVITLAIWAFRKKNDFHLEGASPLFLLILPLLLLIFSIILPSNSIIFETTKPIVFVSLENGLNALVRHENKNYLISCPADFNTKEFKMKIESYYSFFRIHAFDYLILESNNKETGKVSLSSEK